jgi:hypothetical protein
MHSEEQQAMQVLTDAVGAICQALHTMTTMAICRIETEHRHFAEKLTKIQAVKAAAAQAMQAQATNEKENPDAGSDK